MSGYKPGDTIHYEFGTHSPTTGAAADATGTPTAILLRNGADSGETVTVSKVGTGLYRAVVAIPTSWDAGDEAQLRITATVNAVTANKQSDVYVVDSSRVSDVWSNATRTLTQTAAQVAGAVAGSTLTITQSYDFDATISGLTIAAGRSKLWLSVKEAAGDSDDDALIRIEESEGLERINKAEPEDGDESNGTLTADDVAGTVTIHLAAIETAKLTSGNRQLVYDIKQLFGEALTQLTVGAAKVVLGVTLATE